MHTLKIILQIYVILEIAFLILYIPRIRLWFEGYPKQKRLYATEQRRFALLIPARNESRAITPLLESVRDQDYPSSLLDVYVIVKEPDDATIGLTRSILPGATVKVVREQNRKAEALDVCLHEILAGDGAYDAYLIVDADSMLTPGYVSNMNDALESGADVILPRKRIKNWLSDKKENRGLFCNCSAMTYVAIDAMGNKGKSKRNSTLALCGQGMLVSSRVVRDLGGYPFRSLTEDYELAVACMRSGYRQFYYEYAELYSEEPTSRHEYNKRRMRWLRGFMQFNHLYGREVRRITFRQGRIRTENFQFLYCLYPVIGMMVASGVFMLLFLALGIAGILLGTAWAGTAFLLSLLPLAAIYLQLFVFGAVQLTEDRDVNRMTAGEKGAFLFLYPLVMFDYIWIFFAALFTAGKRDEWEPIERIAFDPAELSGAGKEQSK